MFDGVKVSVKDVSFEELFLECMRIAYSAYDAYVAGAVDGSPMVITARLVRAVSACVVHYVSTQSALRTNRPFIAKVLNLECNDMFCAQSDFMQSFLFTNASPEDEAIISLAEKVYDERDFDICDGPVDAERPVDDRAADSAARQAFELGIMIAERNVLGGTGTSLRGPTRLAALTDHLPFHSRVDRTGPSHDGDGTTAMLILATDFEAPHNYVAYVVYLTPSRLSRRYDVNFDCLRRPVPAADLDCCRAREAKKRKQRDSAKVVIRSVIEKKRRERIDAMPERSAACEATLRQSAVAMSRRNGDLLRHVLLMSFDKCLTELIDRGFENLNSRRGYAVNSAKEIGTATVYTSVIDTVGAVSTHVESYAFDGVVGEAEKTDRTQGDENGERRNRQLQYSLPLSAVVTENGPDDGGIGCDGVPRH